MNAKIKFESKRLHMLITAATVALAFPALAMSAKELPAEHHAGPVSYLSGGVGEDEADAIKAAAVHYPLEIELLKHTRQGENEYLAGDRVVIRNTHGATVLDAKADGPFLLARLEPGRYTVSAQDDGIGKNRQVQISAKGHEHLVFEW